MNTLMNIDAASFSYDGKTAVEQVSFDLEKGDYLCIVGENGSGKSTLINGMLGLKQPEQGHITFDQALKHSNIGYLPQQNLTHGSFPASVMEVVLSGRLGLKAAVPFYNQHDRTLAREALSLVHASDLERSWFGGLSGGQRQRVLIARALSIAPDGLKLLILDEPMNGLDPHVRASLYELIEELNSAREITVVMVTHDVNTASHYANKILLLATQQLFYGTTEEFQKSELGIEFLRDACGGQCAICGFSHVGKDHSHA